MTFLLEPRFVAPLVRSQDGTVLSTVIRDYAGEIRVKAQVWTPKPNGTVVAIPLCVAGIPDTACSFDAPEWPLLASVDGGVSWLAEELPDLPGASQPFLGVDTAGTPLLQWRLPDTPAVARWEFQRAEPTYDRWAWDGLTWVDYDYAPEWLFCSSRHISTGNIYDCKRPLPTAVGDDRGEYLYRVRACNFAGCGEWGQEVYAVCIPLSLGVPGNGGAPCFWPDNGACLP